MQSVNRRRFVLITFYFCREHFVSFFSMTYDFHKIVRLTLQPETPQHVKKVLWYYEGNNHKWKLFGAQVQNVMVFSSLHNSYFYKFTKKKVLKFIYFVKPRCKMKEF